jgi:hypothetical protein
MQFHYVVGYDTDAKKWFVDDETKYLDGNVWDNDEQDWFIPRDDTEELIDERCHTMLSTLAPIWPEVDHGDY